MTLHTCKALWRCFCCCGNILSYADIPRSIVLNIKFAGGFGCLGAGTESLALYSVIGKCQRIYTIQVYHFHLIIQKEVLAWLTCLWKWGCRCLGLTPSFWNPSTYVVEGWPMLCTITLSLCHIVNILLSLNAIVTSAFWQFQTPVHRTQIQSWLTTELHRITPLKAEELNMLTHHKVLASIVVFLCVDASV